MDRLRSTPELRIEAPELLPPSSRRRPAAFYVGEITVTPPPARRPRQDHDTESQSGMDEGTRQGLSLRGFDAMEEIHS